MTRTMNPKEAPEMPLILASNDATESGISYDDRTGVSYEYPSRYRKIIVPGERFIYYRGRRRKDGGRQPQVYFGRGVIGTIGPSSIPGRLVCQIVDFERFPRPVPFRGKNGHLEPGGSRSGYYQPGVRPITDETYSEICGASGL